MRLYSFVNMYLSPIQHGIQTAHVVSELSHRIKLGEAHDVYVDWAKNHKTIIVLNAGFSSELRALEELFTKEATSDYPWAQFCEAEESLDGAMTAIGIVVPEPVYELASVVRRNRVGSELLIKFRDSGFGNDIREPYFSEFNLAHYTDFDFQLIEVMNKYKLA